MLDTNDFFLLNQQEIRNFFVYFIVYLIIVVFIEVELTYQ